MFAGKGLVRNYYPCQIGGSDIADLAVKSDSGRNCQEN
jgi:hypothetical protein